MNTKRDEKGRLLRTGAPQPFTPEERARRPQLFTPKGVNAEIDAIRAGTQYQKGSAGRPKGVRNKLTEKFLLDVYSDWQEHGADTLRRMREEEPGDYVRVVARLVPAQVELERRSAAKLTDDELLQVILVAEVQSVAEVHAVEYEDAELVPSVSVEGRA